MDENEKSFYLIYRGNIEEALSKNNVDKYIILNDKLAAIYYPLTLMNLY
ncbi:hypothetical protein H477_1890 [[Clostridium] sordellii ATCC 9714]|nr:hypothetical protein H477_1890 [[Clostridium] sordellii ATCC 9714] [Paeniclostridium sordellii ATCC 9714]